MKILFFRETELKQLNPAIMASQGLAGTENSLICLAQELSKNHTVKVIAPQYRKQFFQSVEYIPFQSYAEVLIQKMLFNPDVLIVSGNPSILFENKLGVLKIIFWQQNHPKELEGRFDISFLLQHNIQIIAPSPEAAIYYNKFYNTNKIIGIYNGVRPEFFNQSKKPIANKITYCGSFTRAKGLYEVLKSAQQLPEYQFYLCGSYDLYGFVDTAYKKLCQDIIEDNTHFLGSLPADKLAKEFSTSSLCIANPLSSNNETCCISALEAMVVGVPVIAGSSEILDSIVSKGGMTTKNLTETIKKFMYLQSKHNSYPIYDNKKFIDSLAWSSISQQWEKILSI